MRNLNSGGAVPYFHVFGYGLSQGQKEQIHIWRRVHFHDFQLCFPEIKVFHLDGRQSTEYNIELELAKNLILDRMLLDYDHVVFISPNYFFESYIGDILEREMLEKFHLISSDQNDEFILEGLRSHEDLQKLPYVISHKVFEAKRLVTDTYTRCNILFRKEYAQTHKLGSFKEIDGGTIVIGISTTSKKTLQVEDHPLITIFLPSLMETAKHNPNWKFLVLVGFDAGDKFFDNPTPIKVILEKARQFMVPNVEIQFLRLIKTGTVTMVWNLLYDLAMRNGARYFYQLNDDITFVNHDWPDKFASLIDQRNGFGLVGPSDDAFACKLTTQNFVGHRHWELFGFLFPPDLHNWWCDNWIHRLYSILGAITCEPDHAIMNGGRKDGNLPRYIPCRDFDYPALVRYYVGLVEPKLQVEEGSKNNETLLF